MSDHGHCAQLEEDNSILSDAVTRLELANADLRYQVDRLCAVLRASLPPSTADTVIARIAARQAPTSN